MRTLTLMLLMTIQENNEFIEKIMFTQGNRKNSFGFKFLETSWSYGVTTGSFYLCIYSKGIIFRRENHRKFTLKNVGGAVNPSFPILCTPD